MYGPIVRINPDELHILDHEYYDEIYGSTTKKRDKYGPWVALAGTPGSSFSTVAHDHHRIRRGALNAFFSKKAVVALEPVVQSKVDILSRRFAKAEATGEVIRIDAAFMALTMDVICQYAFANDDAMLERDDFNVAWKEMIIGAFEGGALLRQFPGMIGMMNIVPDAMMGKMMPSMSLMLDWKHGVRGRIKPILERKEKETTSHRTIFHELRDDHDLPENEKTMDRLCDEGQIFTGAGSETTAKALTTALFYLLVKGDTFSILKKELLQAMPVGKTTSWQKLEQLPYLSAVIAEALRLSHGVTTRLPRIATGGVMCYKDWEIPFGTPISSTMYFILMHPGLFPEPQTFLPERWLTSAGEFNHTLANKYLVNFGRGSRSCLGMNLAYAEMYITLATIVRRFDMELFETGMEDVKMVHDFFVAAPRLNSKGVRIKVIGMS